MQFCDRLQYHCCWFVQSASALQIQRISTVKKIKRILKVIGLSIGILVAIAVLGIVGFMYLSPQFGGQATAEQQQEYAKSGHYEDGEFQNPIPTEMATPSWGTMVKFFQSEPGRNPKANIPVLSVDSADIASPSPSKTELIWFGHSTFLLQLDGKNILLDPMLGDCPAPHPMVGNKRYSAELPIEIEQLPSIEAVLFSHDHYDHLDYGSIIALKDKVAAFYVPLGLGNHLREWGVDPERIHEHNWGDTAELNGTRFTATPARHFSGRGISDRFATLWCSWVIEGQQSKVFFSGDSGYGPHFATIGEEYGPFDIALMECGQYNKEWSNIHMMPEETVQAALDVKAQIAMPIHWGAFTLALHPWTEPVTRMANKAAEVNMPITTPRIGERFSVGEGNYPTSKWWASTE